MKTMYQYTPSGTRDFLFDECKCKKETQAILESSFARAGFSEVLTPLLEYYDVFEQAENTNSLQEMYKLIDLSGRILVLRPDSTLPIARMVGTRLRDGQFPLRLSYTQNVYRNNAGAHGKRNELTQSGLELIGVGGLKADAEIIVAAISALRDCGLREITVELGHIGFFKALISSIPFREEDLEKIRRHVEYKNFAALNDVLDEYGEFEAANNLRMLPQLFGGREIFDTALSIACCSEARDIVLYLTALYDLLLEMGYGDVLTVDLGLVQHMNYYTGLVFRGYARGSGETILSGGRYDKLLSAFGMDLPATGFAINVDETMQLRFAEQRTVLEPAEELVFAQSDCLAKAMLYMQEQRKSGRRMELSLCDTAEESRAYAAKRGIPLVTVVEAGGSTAYGAV